MYTSPPRRGYHAYGCAQQRALPAAVRAAEHRDLPRREAQADVLYYRAVTVSGAEGAELYHAVRPLLCRSSSHMKKGPPMSESVYADGAARRARRRAARPCRIRAAAPPRPGRRRAAAPSPPLRRSGRMMCGVTRADEAEQAGEADRRPPRGPRRRRAVARASAPRPCRGRAPSPAEGEDVELVRERKRGGEPGGGRGGRPGEALHAEALEGAYAEVRVGVQRVGREGDDRVHEARARILLTATPRGRALSGSRLCARL